MSDPASASSPATLGQRIDAVLEPLYAEAEQHRASIEDAKSQFARLQQQIGTAQEGLSQIESKMVEVVRSLANQEPVIAAVLGSNVQLPVEQGSAESAQVQEAPAQELPAPVAESDPETEAVTEPVAEAEPPAPVQAVMPPAPQPTSQAEPIENEVSALSLSEAALGPDGTVPLDLDPEIDKAMVDEAASLLSEMPMEQPDAAVAPEPATVLETAAPADIAAAAERAAAAAKELRAKAGTPK